MKRVFFFILVSFGVSRAFAGECSKQNLDALLHLTSRLIGDGGIEATGVFEIFRLPHFDKMTAAQIKEAYLRVKKEGSAYWTQDLDAVESFVKKYPECDPDHLFSLKTAVSPKNL